MLLRTQRFLQERTLGPAVNLDLPALALLTQDGGPDVKESACNAGDVGLIPGWGRFPGGGNGNSLQYPFLENPIDRGVYSSSGCKKV